MAEEKAGAYVKSFWNYLPNKDQYLICYKFSPARCLPVTTDAFQLFSEVCCMLEAISIGNKKRIPSKLVTIMYTNSGWTF